MSNWKTIPIRWMDEKLMESERLGLEPPKNYEHKHKFVDVNLDKIVEIHESDGFCYIGFSAQDGDGFITGIKFSDKETLKTKP